MIKQGFSRRILTAGAVLLALSGAAVTDAGAQGRAPTVTRLVRLFGTLENDLGTAAQQHDRATLERLLADDFELRSGAAPAIPVPRADWMAQTLKEPAHAATITQMAAHDFGGPVVVSYASNTAEGSVKPAPLFVVDVWSQENGQWRLRTRYISAVAENAAVPGVPAATAELPKKY